MLRVSAFPVSASNETKSCRHERWLSSVKYLVEDLPVLLKSESLHSVKEILSLIFESLPTNAENFIKWMAEVRRKEEDKDSSFLSEEEKARLVAKEGLLQQVHETKLFNIVRDWLSSCCSTAQSCCDNIPFSEIANNVCCQGAVLLSGGLRDNVGLCCRSTCVKFLNPTEQTPVKIVSGSVISGDTEQKVDMLVPLSPSTSLSSSSLRSCCSSASDNCVGMHPGSNDVLTVLLLALPSDTWMGIRDERLLAQIFDLVSTEKLPDVLQQEVLHLRQQLSFLVRCKGKEVDGALEFQGSV